MKPTWEELFPDSSPRKKPTFDEVMSTPKANVTSLPEIQASGPSRIEVGRIEVESSPSKPTLRPTQRTPYAQQRFNFQVSAPKLAPTPQKTELPAEYLTDDSTLTPQQVIEKYRKIAQDTTLPKKEREKLIKQGKDVLGNIMQANNKLKTFGYKPLYENVTPEEAKQAQDVYSLLQTRTAGAAVMANTLDSLTFGFGEKAFDSVNDKILEKAKEAGVDVPDAPTLTQITQQSKEEHPVASAAGQLIGRAPIYQGLGAVLGKVPAYVALQSGKLPARLVAGRIIDVVPDALDAISQEDNTADRIKQFAINQATGLVFDTALEGLGAAVKAGTKKLRPNDVAESAAKSVDTPTLKPAEAPTIKPEAPSLKPTETPAVKPVEPELKPKGIDDIQAKTPTEPTFGKNTVSAAERNLASYDAMQNMYGTIKPGELPHGREVDVPKSTDGTDKVRQYARTVMEAPATPDSLIKDFEDAVAAGEFSYKPKRDKDALDMAVKTITDKGYDGALKQWKDIIDGNRVATKEDMVLGQLLYAEAAKAGDTKLAMELAAEIAAEGTKLGQGIQALRLLKKMTPEGRLYYAQKMVDHLNKDLADQLKGQKIEIGHDLAQRLLKASSMEEADQISDLIMKHVAEQVPATWLDKWNAWRYLSMLGNPRTHIRNLLGNAIFVPARKIKNMIGAGIESGTNAVLKPFGKSIDRTKAILTSADEPLKEFAKSDFIKMKDIVTAGGKLNPSDIIQENRKIFDNKALEAIRKFNTTALEWEDGLFLKGAYAESMAQYMKANKLTPEFLNSGTQEAKAALKKARDYAILEAQKATYRDASKVADALNKLKKTNAVTNVIGEGLVPFTKTPINIVKRGYEYSPLRFIQTLTWDLSKLKAGEKTAAEVIDGIASGLTGTGIIALGAWMASKGLVTGGKLENKKEDEFSELQGEQHYALKIGDSSYTIDWTAPVSLPFFIGVELFNQANGEHPEVGIERILDSMTSISEPMINMSMLQGINNAIKTAGYSETPLTSGMVSTAIGYMGQAVPTLLGQVARSIDPIRRTTFTEAGSPNQDIQRQVQKAQAKIPFASQKLQPYVDQWGRTQENIGGSFLGRLAYNTLSPGYYSRIRSTPLDQELGRLQQAESNTSVLPSKPQKYFTVGGERKNLNAKEYTEYARAKGNLSYEIADKIRLNPAYNQLSDQEKASVIEDVYKYADALARKQIAPDYKLDAWIEKAQNSPVPIDEYIIQRNRYNNLEPVKDKNGKTIESAADAYRKYLLSNMDLTAEEKVALDRDFTGAKNVPDYSSKDAYYLSQLTEKQRERYEKFNHGLLTAEAYYEVVKAAGKGGTKQEKIKLIEAIGYSPKEARKIYARILSK